MEAAIIIIRPVQIFRIWVLALVLLTAAGAQAAGPWYVATNGAVDLDGRKRIHYGIVDMGAYERIHSGTIYGFR